MINGRLRRLTIVGVALSPEFVYTIPPGDLVPDDRRYRRLLDGSAGAGRGLRHGGRLQRRRPHPVAPDASADEVIARIDRILEPYGGLGAIPRALQLSHWTVENELSQLQTFGFMLPLIFLMVAAFILNVALTRALALQRPQIAALKALGYGNLAIGWHYLKWALAIGAGGVVIGIAGRRLARHHADRRCTTSSSAFPSCSSACRRASWSARRSLTLVAAGAGAFGAVRRAVRVPPAEAMRPEAPARYRRTVLETPLIARHLGNAGRMVLRNVTRHPLRAAASVFGIAFAVAILMIGFVFTDAIEQLIQTQFWEAERQDVTVSFVEPETTPPGTRWRGCRASLPSSRSAASPSRIRSGHRERYLADHRRPAEPALQAHRRPQRPARSGCRRRASSCR